MKLPHIIHVGRRAWVLRRPAVLYEKLYFFLACFFEISVIHVLCSYLPKTASGGRVILPQQGTKYGPGLGHTEFLSVPQAGLFGSSFIFTTLLGCKWPYYYHKDSKSHPVLTLTFASVAESEPKLLSCANDVSYLTDRYL